MELIIFICYIILINTLAILIAIGIGKLIIKYLDKKGYLKENETQKT